MKPRHQSVAWRIAAQSRLNYYLKKRDHTLIFSKKFGVACLNPATRTVYINPDLFEAHPRARGLPLDPTELRKLSLEGLIAHEAAHVHYSGKFPKESQHFMLVNCLEDERIERLMTHDYPALERHFTLLGDLCCAQGEANWTGSILEGCLVWRWQHDRASVSWVPGDPFMWEDVRPLVEAAWRAPNTERVVWIAQMILALCGETRSPDLPNFGMSLGGHAEGESPAGESQKAEESKDGSAAGDSAAGDSAAGDSAAGDSADPASPRGAGSGVSTQDTPQEWPTGDTPEPPVAHHLSPRRLAALLRPAQDPGRQMSHTSRGRFDYGRFASGSEKSFRVRSEPQRPRATHLSLAIDVSGSMRGEPLTLASVAATLLLRAAQLADVQFDAWSFESYTTKLGDSKNAPALKEALLRLSAQGGTLLAPALHSVVKHLAPPGDARIVVVLCDGELGSADLEQVRNILSGVSNKAPSGALRFLMVLLGEASAAHSWDDLRRGVPRSALHFVRIDDPQRLLPMLEAALLALHSRA